MHRGSLRTWLFALACGLMAVGLARSDEPRSTWFTRLFMPGMKTAAETKKDDPAAKPAAPVVVVDEKSAKDEWLRRVEVCDKLREIAAENRDDDLKRRADQLEARAWEAYARKTGARSVTGDAVEETTATDAGRPRPRPATTVTPAAPAPKEERR